MEPVQGKEILSFWGESSSHDADRQLAGGPACQDPQRPPRVSRAPLGAQGHLAPDEGAAPRGDRVSEARTLSGRFMGL